MLQLVTALKLITAVVIECAVVTLVTLSVVSDKRLQISREPVSQCDHHRWVHRAKATEQDMLLVSQLAQLRPRFVQLHRRACVQRVQLQLSVEADKLKQVTIVQLAFEGPCANSQNSRLCTFCSLFRTAANWCSPEDLCARRDMWREWRCGSGKMGSGHCGHFDETHRTGSTEDGLHADAAHASLPTLCRRLLLPQTRTSFL